MSVCCERGREQRFDFGHEPLLVPPYAVPLEQRELGLMPAAQLVIAKHAADLVDVTAAGCEQPFHRELRRRVQILRARTEALDERTDVLERRVGDAGRRQRRRLDLEHAALREEAADRREDRCTSAQRVVRGRRDVGHRNSVTPRVEIGQRLRLRAPRRLTWRRGTPRGACASEHDHGRPHVEPTDLVAL